MKKEERKIDLTQKIDSYLIDCIFGDLSLKTSWVMNDNFRDFISDFEKIYIITEKQKIFLEEKHYLDS